MSPINPDTFSFGSGIPLSSTTSSPSMINLSSSGRSERRLLEALNVMYSFISESKNEFEYLFGYNLNV